MMPYPSSNQQADLERFNRVEPNEADNKQQTTKDIFLSVEFPIRRWPMPPSPEAVEKRNKYYNLVAASEEFYSDEREKREFVLEFEPLCAALVTVSPESRVAKHVGMQALKIFNEKEGKNLTFKRLIRGNEQLVNGWLYYLTFEASDDRFYEAKLVVPPSFKLEDIAVEFVRLARHYPTVQFPQTSVPIDQSCPPPIPPPYVESVGNIE